jgi:hypothetical protein
MNAHSGGRGVTLSLHKWAGGQRQGSAALPRESDPVHTAQEAGQATGPLWTSTKNLPPVLSLGLSSPESVAIPTTLSRPPTNAIKLTFLTKHLWFDREIVAAWGDFKLKFITFSAYGKECNICTN